MLRALAKSKIGLALIVFVVIALVVFAGATGMSASVYNPQWELRATIVGLQNSPETRNWGDLPEGVALGADGFWYTKDEIIAAILAKRPIKPAKGTKMGWVYGKTPGDVGYSVNKSIYEPIYQISGTKVRHDFDAAAFGEPDIEVTTSDVRKDELKPFENVTVQGFNYEILKLASHFEVKIRSVADAVRVPGDDTRWIHETAMGFEWKTNLLGSGGEHIGQEFSGGAYVKFSCNPWGMEDYGVNPNTFKRFWYGLMNMEVEAVTIGQVGSVPESEIQHKGWVHGLAGVNDQLSMIPENPKLGGVYSRIPWDPQKILDPDIRSSAIAFLPADIMAGARDSYDVGYFLGMGGITDVLPIDYYVIYTVRVEACLVREYGSTEEPNTGPDYGPLQPPVDYSPYNPTTFWDKYGTWIIIAVIIGIVLAIIGGVLFGIPLLMMFMRY
jgi:hypothetical protein